MNSYRRIIKRRNNLYYEYKVLCKTLMNFNITYDRGRELYRMKEKIYKQFIFYQKLLEGIDNGKEHK